MQDFILMIGGGVLIMLGLLGAVLPLPGPPLSFIGLLMVHYSKYAEFSLTTLVIYGITMAVLFVLDYLIPAWGAKKFGGTSWGAWGATIGLVVGLFIPLGILIGPFVGAFVGELLKGAPSQKALRSAVGSFLGLLSGMLMKVMYCLATLFLYAKELYQYFY